MNTDPPAARERWPYKDLLAAIAAIVPMAAIAIWMNTGASGPPTIKLLLPGPMLGGGIMIFWILLLHLVLCNDRIETFGFRRGTIGSDLIVGGGLGVAFLVIHLSTTPLLRQLFPPSPPAEEIVELIDHLSRNPWMIALWLGPVVWIGVALFEELWRVFMLRRAWNLLRGPAGRWAGILIVSALVGLGHIYQGPAAILAIGFKSVMMGWFFMATGRIRPLIVAHAVYDSIQIVMAVVAIRGLSGG